jgi:hypothetical protein
VALLRLLDHGDRLLALLLSFDELGVQLDELDLQLGLLRLARLLELLPDLGDGLLDELFLALDLPQNAERSDSRNRLKISRDESR